MAIKAGDKIKVEYEGSLDDGTVFDKSEAHGKPLEFEVGAGQVVKGFEDAVMGMEKGEEKTFKLEPKDAYGDVNPEMVKEVPKEQLKVDTDLEAGMMLGITLPNGAQVPARIAAVTDKNVELDMNHPLAGKNLTFKIKVVDIA